MLTAYKYGTAKLSPHDFTAQRYAMLGYAMPCVRPSVRHTPMWLETNRRMEVVFA